MRGLSKMNFQDIWNSSTGVVRNRAGSPLWLVLVILLGTFLCCAVSTWRWRFQIWWCLRRWTLSLCIRTQHQHMIKRSEIIQLPGSAWTQERHLFWCWKQIGASKFTGPAWITQLTTPSEVIPKICPLTVCNSFIPMKISDLVMHSNMIKTSEIIQWLPWSVRRQVQHLFCIYASPSQFSIADCWNTEHWLDHFLPNAWTIISRSGDFNQDLFAIKIHLINFQDLAQ